MGIYTSQSLYVARLINDINKKHNEEVIICQDEFNNFLVTKKNNATIQLPKTNNQIELIKDKYFKCIDLNVVKSFLKFNSMNFNLDCDKEYDIYYVSDTFMSFNKTCNKYFIKCIIDEDSQKRVEDFDNKYKDYYKKCLEKKDKNKNIKKEIYELQCKIEKLKKEINYDSNCN